MRVSTSDMRDIRGWLRPYWAGKRVLNTFAYTGAFSVAAAANGASRVDTVDLASSAIARAERNGLNDLDTASHGFWVEDTFKALIDSVVLATHSILLSSIRRPSRTGPRASGR